MYITMILILHRESLREKNIHEKHAMGILKYF